MNDRHSIEICFYSNIQRKRSLKHAVKDDSDAGVKQPPIKKQKTVGIEALLKQHNLSMKDLNELLISRSKAKSNHNSQSQQ